MANEWSNDQSSQITDLYGQLKGNYERQAYNKLFSGPHLPYLDAFNTLTGLIEQQKAEQSGVGLEKKVDTAPGRFFPSQRLKYAIGLGTVIALVLGLPPYIP